MNPKSRLAYEAAGVGLLIGAGVASVVVAALLSPLVPWLRPAWVFVVLVVAVLGAALVGIPSGRERSTDEEQPEEGGVVGVDLLDWANDRVGGRCVACESEIEYVPLGSSGGQSAFRIECGCTVIESRAKS